MGIRRHIPNSITSLNLLCGTIGIVLSLKGHVDTAFYFMLGGALADFCDGLSARLLGAYSPMGKELDSLADQVTFGVLPSVMMWEQITEATSFSEPVAWSFLLIAVFSGLRLAKFNIDSRQATSFIGLPTPACAMICGSAAYYLNFKGLEYTSETIGVWAVPAVFVLCYALVCETPMFSMKFHKGDRLGWQRIAFFAFAAASVAAVALCGANWSLAVLATFIAYIIINIIQEFIEFVKK